MPAAHVDRAATLPRIALGLVACLVLAGCAVTSKFEVIDATTHEPLEGVQVKRYEFREWALLDALGSKPPPPVPEVPLGPTGADGTLTSSTPWRRLATENHHSFMFFKPGYEPAEAHVEGGKAQVASPSYGGRWLWNGAPVAPPPTAYDRTVSARPTIRVPMFASEPTSATDGRRR
jgi:hypothetical protein